MNRFASAALLVVAAVVAVVGQRLLSHPEVVVDRESLASSSVQAEVISVEPSSKSAAGGPGLSHAVVKLSSGQTVRATVLGGCLVLPGQTTRVSKLGDGRGSSYIVIENGK